MSASDKLALLHERCVAERWDRERIPGMGHEASQLIDLAPRIKAVVKAAEVLVAHSSAARADRIEHGADGEFGAIATLLVGLEQALDERVAP